MIYNSHTYQVVTELIKMAVEPWRIVLYKQEGYPVKDANHIGIK